MQSRKKHGSTVPLPFVRTSYSISHQHFTCRFLINTATFLPTVVGTLSPADSPPVPLDLPRFRPAHKQAALNLPLKFTFYFNRSSACLFLPSIRNATNGRPITMKRSTYVATERCGAKKEKKVVPLQQTFRTQQKTCLKIQTLARSHNMAQFQFVTM